MSDESLPVFWYAVLDTESNNIRPYLDIFELMRDPRLEPLDINGQKLGKLTYSVFGRYTDYEEVLRETRELASLLTGTLRIRWEPGAISIINIVGVFEDGSEEKFPPYGRPARLSMGMGYVERKAGAKPHPTSEQHMLEYVIRTGDPLVKDALRYMSSSPDFFGLFKVLEVIGWDLGRGSKSKGYRLIQERGWANKKELKDFRLTADKTYRHWDKNHPAPKMDLRKARIIFTRIIEEWIAYRGGFRLPPVNMRPGWTS